MGRSTFSSRGGTKRGFCISQTFSFRKNQSVPKYSWMYFRPKAKLSTLQLMTHLSACFRFQQGKYLPEPHRVQKTSIGRSQQRPEKEAISEGLPEAQALSRHHKEKVIRSPSNPLVYIKWNWQWDCEFCYVWINIEEWELLYSSFCL